jgi:ABC-2 type transport system permease protein
MRNTLTVGRYTFIELFKSRISYVTLILGLFVLLVTYISSEFTYGSPSIVALDIGLGVLSLFSLLVSFLLGLNLISQEIESRTIYMVLSRSIGREEFFLGKSLGLIAILFLNISVIFCFSLFLFIMLNGTVDALIFNAFIMIVVESVIVLLLILLFSLLTNKVITLIITFVIYFSGHAIPEVMAATFVKSNHVLESILNIIKYSIPALHKFNIKEYVLYSDRLPVNYLQEAYIYGIAWILFLLMCNFIVFRRIEFK